MPKRTPSYRLRKGYGQADPPPHWGQCAVVVQLGRWRSTRTENPDGPGQCTRERETGRHRLACTVDSFEQGALCACSE